MNDCCWREISLTSVATSWVESHSIRPPSMQYERAPHSYPYTHPFNPHQHTWPWSLMVGHSFLAIALWHFDFSWVDGSSTLLLVLEVQTILKKDQEWEWHKSQSMWIHFNINNKNNLSTFMRLHWTAYIMHVMYRHNHNTKTLLNCSNTYVDIWQQGSRLHL